MRRKPFPGKHYRRLGHACTSNSMTSAAILSAEPTGQRLKLALIRLSRTSVALGDAVPKPLGFVALCQKHGRGEGDVPQRQRRPCPWTAAALRMLAGRAGSQTPRRTAALRAEGIAFGVPTCPPRRRMEYIRDRVLRKETSPGRRQVGCGQGTVADSGRTRQVGGLTGRRCRSAWNTDRHCSSCSWPKAENPGGLGAGPQEIGCVFPRGVSVKI